MNEIQKFTQALMAAGMVFDKEINEAKVRVYLRALQPHSPADCTRALERLISTSKFMPKPADIIEALEGDTHAQALTAWPEVERLARNSSSASSSDPITQAVVSEMGGWRRFGHAEYREYPFLQREFIDRYQTYKTTPALLEKATQAQLGVRTNKTLKLVDIVND